MLFHSFLRSSADSCMSPDQGSSPQPGVLGRRSDQLSSQPGPDGFFEGHAPRLPRFPLLRLSVSASLTSSVHTLVVLTLPHSWVTGEDGQSGSFSCFSSGDPHSEGLKREQGSGWLSTGGLRLMAQQIGHQESGWRWLQSLAKAHGVFVLTSRTTASSGVRILMPEAEHLRDGGQRELSTRGIQGAKWATLRRHITGALRGKEGGRKVREARADGRARRCCRWL